MADSERRTRHRWLVWLAAALVLLGLITALALWWRPLYEFVADQEQIRTWVETLGAWGPLAVVLLEVVQALLAPVPGQAIEIVSGYLYGPWWGTIYAITGIAIGSTITFLLGRQFGRPLLIRLAGPASMDRLDDLARRGGTLFFFLIWLFPFAPDDLACMAAGLTVMPLRQFLALMIVGRIPGITISVLVGANVATIQPFWWGILLVAMAIAALVVWRWGEQIQKWMLTLIERIAGRRGS